MGETCKFSESGTSVVKFCENGCCDNQCCTDTSIDTKALAIAIAVILAVLLLIALIVLIIYCCLKRSKRANNKTDWRHKDMALTEMQPGKKQNTRQMNGIIGPFRKTNTLVQTGDPNINPGDHILWGHTHRFSSTNNSKSGPAKPAWNQGIKPNDTFTQTPEDNASHYTQTHLPNSVYTDEPHYQRSSLSQSLISSDLAEHQNKGVQTAAPKSNPPGAKKLTGDKNMQYLPWTPTAPWKPSAQVKSLSRNTPKPLNTGPENNHPEIQPFYPVHRCSPGLALESEQPDTQSASHIRSSDSGIYS